MTYLLLSAGLALCALCYCLERSRFGINRFPTITSFCFLLYYSTAGQAVLFKTGYEIYRGIRTDAIDQSLLICLTALLGLISSILVSTASFHRRGEPTSGVLIENQASARLSRIMLIAITAIVALFAARYASLAFVPKGFKLAQVGSMHYALLLIWQIAYVVHLANEWKITRIIGTSLAIFAVYCLIMSERDFVFSGTAAALIAMQGSLKLRKGPLVFIGLIFLLAVYLTSGRGGNFDEALWVSSLSQGSNLFVNSFVYNYVDGTGNLLHGSSYLNTIVSTFTFGIVKLENSLSDWLAYMYAGPYSDTGYGFSLEAEGFLNFGFIGVFVSFFLLGFLICYGVKKAYTGQILPRIIYIWTVVFLFYQVRQESLVVLKTLWLCMFVAIVIRFFAISQRRDQLGRFANSPNMSAPGPTAGQ